MYTMYDDSDDSMMKLYEVIIVCIQCMYIVMMVCIKIFIDIKIFIYTYKKFLYI